MSERSPAFRRFVASMNIGYEEWHDGIGYDTDALGRCSTDERRQAENILLRRGVKDWRDLEALHALRSLKATAAINATLKSHEPELRLRAAQLLQNPDEIEAAVINVFENGGLFHGLTHALDEAAKRPTPKIREALLRLALAGESVAAVHAVALLFYLHGLAKEAFDWAHRPFFLRFSTQEKGGRTAAFQELCDRLGVDAKKYTGASD